MATAAYSQSVDWFPSIIVGPNRSIIPLGPFAEAQAQVRSSLLETLRIESFGALLISSGRCCFWKIGRINTSPFERQDQL
jgi:hypothetical protein